jgi:ferrous iron transport protein A
MSISRALCNHGVTKCELLAFTGERGKPHTPAVDSLPSPGLSITRTPISLNELQQGEVVRVSGLALESTPLTTEEKDLLIGRLRDLGFVAGARCEVLARMWFGGDPVVVRIGGSTFALRRAEAAAVRVQRLETAATVA